MITESAGAVPPIPARMPAHVLEDKMAPRPPEPHPPGPGLTRAFEHRVSWGWCDAAGIVFYPRYYELFDMATQALLRGVGLDHHTLRARYGVVGMSLVEAKATFRAPATFDEVLTVTTEVARVGERSVRLEHRVERGGTLLVAGYEARVWAREKDEGPGLTAAPIPLEVRRALLGEGH